jgi:hemoglobin
MTISELNTSDNLYTRLGGEAVIRAFVNHLYDYMESTASVGHIRSMHSADLSLARERLFMFLSGMLGGPPIYMDKFGPPRLRRKHLHFDIGNEERDQWLSCAQHAINLLDIDGHLCDELMRNLTVMANHLRNKNTDSTPCLSKTV